MNCYGTNPRYTQQLQPVNNMNSMNTNQPLPQAQSNLPAQTYQNPYNTTTTSDWSRPVPTNPNMPTSPASVEPVVGIPLPPTLTDPIYTPAFLSQHIGDLMRVEFLIGNNMTDRVGRLKTVGASFIVLLSLDSSSEIVCDIYSIKFVTIIKNERDAQLFASFQR